MRRIHALDGLTYTKLPYDDFIANVDVEGCTRHTLAASTYGSRPIIGQSIGNINNPMILIHGNLHGAHEWRTCYWVKRFLEYVADASHPIYKEFFLKLKTRYCLYVIPALNPYGYDNAVRYNANGVDLNRNFDYKWEEWNMEDYSYGGPKGSAPFSEPETAQIRDLIQQYKPFLYIDCHTDGGKTRIVYETGSPRYNVLFKDSKKTCENMGGVNEFGLAEDLEQPKAGAYGGSQFNKRGDNIISLAVESGGNLSEYEQARQGMTMLLSLCMESVEWYEKHVLN